MVAFNFNSSNVPPDHILKWCRNHVRLMKDGGVWGIPRSKTVFRVDKENQLLILISPGEDDGDDFRATKHVFSFIGWGVITEQEFNDV
jgi:hypothetical protein